MQYRLLIISSCCYHLKTSCCWCIRWCGALPWFINYSYCGLFSDYNTHCSRTTSSNCYSASSLKLGMSLIGGRSVKAHAFVSSVVAAMNGCVTAVTASVRAAIGEATTTTVSSAVQTSRLEVSFQWGFRHLSCSLQGLQRATLSTSVRAVCRHVQSHYRSPYSQ